MLGWVNEQSKIAVKFPTAACWGKMQDRKQEIMSEKKPKCYKYEVETLHKKYHWGTDPIEIH